MGAWGWPFRRDDAPARIAPAETRHAADLAEIHRDGFERPWSESDFEALLAESAVVGHVLMARGARPAAFVLSRRAADEAEILSIVVARRSRRLGHGGALLRRHMEGLAELGLRRLFLEVEAENLPAIALYRRRGFVEAGRRRSYYRKADGSAADALIMRADL